MNNTVWSVRRARARYGWMSYFLWEPRECELPKEKDMVNVYTCETEMSGRVCGYKRSADQMCAVHIPGHQTYQVACVKCAGIARKFGFETENLAVVQSREAAEAEADRRREEERTAYWETLATAAKQDRQADAKARRQQDRQQRDEHAIEYQARRNGAVNGYVSV